MNEYASVYRVAYDSGDGHARFQEIYHMMRHQVNPSRLSASLTTEVCFFAICLATILVEIPCRPES